MLAQSRRIRTHSTMCATPPLTDSARRAPPAASPPGLHRRPHRPLSRSESPLLADLTLVEQRTCLLRRSSLADATLATHGVLPASDRARPVTQKFSHAVHRSSATRFPGPHWRRPADRRDRQFRRVSVLTTIGRALGTDSISRLIQPTQGRRSRASRVAWLWSCISSWHLLRFPDQSFGADDPDVHVFPTARIPRIGLTSAARPASSRHRPGRC